MQKKKPARKRISSPFSENLQQVLKEKSLSQRKAAEIAGVNSATISQWLTGSMPHDHLAVLKLCNTLKVDFQWMMTGTIAERKSKDISLSELFDIQDAPDFSGLFLIEAKRLKRRE